jgi:UMF1 family MFS transporter
MTLRPSQPTPASRSQSVAWALWDCGSTGLNAIAATFVFSVYLTSSVGKDIAEGRSAASYLGWALAAAGLLVAVLAPITGVWADVARRRRATLAVLSAICAALTASMSLIRDDPSYLWAGLILLGLTAACCDLAMVPYNAMLRQLTTPQTVGRVSGLGSAAGFLGTVGLLLIVFFGFIDDDGGSFGFLGLSDADGQNVRLAMLATAVWFAAFALPVLIAVPSPPPSPEDAEAPRGVRDVWRKLRADVTGEWRRDRNVIYYLLASAVFRDGLNGVFAFGAVIGVSVYGVSEIDVLIFGAGACVVAGLGAVIGGRIDDRIGSRPVILFSLAAILVVGSVMIALSGQLPFWICGLLLCLFIGPATASARTLLLRMTPEGREGMAFGLYTTTGRAASFLSPFLFATFISLFGADRAGIAGLGVVLLAGLIALLFVRTAPVREPVPS